MFCYTFAHTTSDKLDVVGPFPTQEEAVQHATINRVLGVVVIRPLIPIGPTKKRRKSRAKPATAVNKAE